MSNVDHAARKRLESQSKDYYPTIDELIEEDVSTVSKHLHKMQKDWVISLFRDLLAQHKTTRKLVNELPNIDDIKETVNEVVKEKLANCSKMNEQLKKFVSEGVKEVYTENPCALEKRSFTRSAPDQVILNQIRINGIPEAKANSTEELLNAEHNQVDNLIHFLGEQTNVQNIRRLGKQNPNRKQPRTMLVTVSSPWEVRKLLAKGRKLVDYDFPVFLSRALNQDSSREINATQKACPNSLWSFETRHPY